MRSGGILDQIDYITTYCVLYVVAFLWFKKKSFVELQDGVQNWFPYGDNKVYCQKVRINGDVILGYTKLDVLLAKCAYELI